MLKTNWKVCIHNTDLLLENLNKYYVQFFVHVYFIDLTLKANDEPGGGGGICL